MPIISYIIIFVALLYILIKHIITDKDVVKTIQVNTGEQVENIYIKRNTLGMVFRYRNLEFRVLGFAMTAFKRLK